MTAKRTEPGLSGSASAPGAGCSSVTVVTVARRTSGRQLRPAEARRRTEREECPENDGPEREDEGPADVHAPVRRAGDHARATNCTSTWPRFGASGMRSSSTS